MKVGCLVDSVSRQAGGLFESIRGLTRSLAAVDGAVEVFGIADADSGADAPYWRPVSVHSVQPQLRGWGYSNELLPALLKAALDVLLSNGLWKYTSIASHKWHKQTGKPYIVHAHGMLDPWAINNSKWKKRIAAFLYESTHLRDAACLRALCKAEAEAIRRFGLRNPICVIPNGIDLPDKKSTRARSWPELTGDRAVLLYLGRLHPKKNLLALLEAWRSVQLEDRVSQWALVIAGWDDGGYESLLRERIKILKMERSAFVVGPLFNENKAAAYENAAAFVLPSFSEGLPMAVLEAWSFAKPVLMTSECNLPEGFTANAAVHIATDPDTIANGLRRLFAMNEEGRAEMGLRGRALVARDFSWSEIGKEMKRVCEWVVSGGAAPASVRFD
jgi:poly(glycerol-phosphate) alpha-glucosyltransferase